MSKLKAFFIDRDGVINIEKNYLFKINDFEFIDGVFEALSYLQEKGYKLFIITNQSGISRNLYTSQDFEILTNWMLDVLQNEKIYISSVEFCPHSPEDNCNCRKPKTGMIENIMNRFDIDINESWLIGDKDVDIQCAYNMGINNTIQVRSGHLFEENKSTAQFIIDSIKNIKEVI